MISLTISKNKRNELVSHFLLHYRFFLYWKDLNEHNPTQLNNLKQLNYYYKYNNTRDVYLHIYSVSAYMG